MSSSPSTPTATATAPATAPAISHPDAAKFVEMAHHAQIFLLAFASCIALYFLWLGYACAALWYYEGRLGPRGEEHVILTAELRARLDDMRRQSQATTAFEPEPEEPPRTAQRNHRISFFPGIHRNADANASQNPRHTIFPGALRPPRSPIRWKGSTVVTIRDGEEREIHDPEVRRAILEEKRISRLPAFVQDDCGDGSEFPDVPEVDYDTYLRAGTPPAEQVQFRDEDRGVGMRRGMGLGMGMKKLEPGTWLQIDSEYVKMHDARTEILMAKREEAVQVQPEGEAACQELMEEVVAFLLESYPESFDVVERVPGQRKIRNKAVREELALRRPYDCHPLEMCARLAVEDFGVLGLDDFTGQWYLWANATLCPAGWRMRDRIGKSITGIQGAWPAGDFVSVELPEIMEQLSYLHRTGENTSVERETLYVQVDAGKGLEKMLFVQRGMDFFSGGLQNLSPTRYIIRRERQTFRCLPKSNTIVFTTKTSFQRLTDVPVHEREALKEEIKAWSAEVATYKGRDLWGPNVYRFCDGKRQITLEDDYDLMSNAGTSTL